MMDYTLRVDRTGEQVIPDLVSALQRQGLQVTISFDLRLARAAHTECSCPYHGTENCTCQYAVLLVYASEHGYQVCRTIVVHGRDGQVWLSLLKDLSSPTENDLVYEAVEAILIDTLLSLANTPGTETVETNQPLH